MSNGALETFNESNYQMIGARDRDLLKLCNRDT